MFYLYPNSTIIGMSCDAPPGARGTRTGRDAWERRRGVAQLEVSDLVIGAIPLGDPRPGKGKAGAGVVCGAQQG